MTENTPQEQPDEPENAELHPAVAEVEEALRTDERQLQAAALRIAGVSLQQIADRLGYAAPSGAWHAAEAGLKAMFGDTPTSEREMARRLELARLDEMLVGVWRKARNGDLGGIDRVLKIMERRARYLELDGGSAAALTGETELDKQRRAREERRRAASS